MKFQNIIFFKKVAPLIEDSRIISEGLISTYPLEKSHNIIKRAGFDVDYNRDFEDDVPDQYKIKLSNGVMVNNALHIKLTPGEYENSETLKKLDRLIKVLGYFVSHIEDIDAEEYVNIKKSSWISKIAQFNSTGDDVLIRLEAKYDIEIDLNTLGDQIFHITTKEAYEKIKKIGLTPKTKSKIAYHPERVYFAFSSKRIYDLAEMLGQHLGSDDVIILSIDVSKLKNKSWFKVYHDVDLVGMDGGYTLNNVPPQYISIYKEKEV